MNFPGQLTLAAALSPWHPLRVTDLPQEAFQAPLHFQPPWSGMELVYSICFPLEQTCRLTHVPTNEHI